MIYYISDHHFGHKNIIKYSNRPFETVHEMNAHMISEHNKIVKPDDHVWFLGDLCLGSDVDKIVPKLNGHKFFVYGNHDKKNRAKLRANFTKCYDTVTVNDGGRLIELNHYPETQIDEYKQYLLYGHSHLLPIDDSRKISCCVELLDYKPRTLDELIEKRKESKYLWLQESFQPNKKNV